MMNNLNIPSQEELIKAYEAKMKLKETQKAYTKRAKDGINKQHQEYYKKQVENNTEFIQKRKEYFREYYQRRKLFPQMQILT